jgi:hypothetical protein
VDYVVMALVVVVLLLALALGGAALARTSERTRQPSFKTILPLWNFLRRSGRTG